VSRLSRVDCPTRFGPIETRLFQSDNHQANLLEAVRGRTRPAAALEASLRSDTICPLAPVAIKRERPLGWGPEQERFLDDDEANRLLDRLMRAPWRIE
jgi:hypothetical protein